MEQSHPSTCLALSSGGGFCICYSWWQKAKGKTMFFSVCVSTTCWLPGASQIATTIVICTRPAPCRGGFPETLPFGGLTQDREAVSFPPWGTGLWKRRGGERPLLLGGSPQRDPILLSHGSLEQVGQDGLPTQSPGPGLAQGGPEELSLLYQAEHPGWHAVPPE